mmetsp:Transcript_2974/g.10865  ORF Transcript_2974/g.10865 Transcript_2974/m.10865 type:complete len:333 (-) Transcript_2974:953-1951(-)
MKQCARDLQVGEEGAEWRIVARVPIGSEHLCVVCLDGVGEVPHRNAVRGDFDEAPFAFLHILRRRIIEESVAVGEAVRGSEAHDVQRRVVPAPDELDAIRAFCAELVWGCHVVAAVGSEVGRDFVRGAVAVQVRGGEGGVKLAAVAVVEHHEVPFAGVAFRDPVSAVAAKNLLVRGWVGSKIVRVPTAPVRAGVAKPPDEVASVAVQARGMARRLLGRERVVDDVHLALGVRGEHNLIEVAVVIERVEVHDLRVEKGAVRHVHVVDVDELRVRRNLAIVLEVWEDVLDRVLGGPPLPHRLALARADAVVLWEKLHDAVVDATPLTVDQHEAP